MKEAKNPRLIIVAGPNGSGKTTITEKLLRHEWMGGCVYINPDIIAEEKFNGWNLRESIIKAANHAKEMREECLSRKMDMAFETVFSSPEKFEFVKRAKVAGFFLRLFFVCTDDPSINARRVASRVMEGGHDVPIPKIISRYYRSLSNCANALPLFDRAYFYDNSLENADPVLIFRTTHGKMAKVYGEAPPWAEDIANSS
ncbi:AAA family ATPase [Candidatus Desulfarcum epimagneticum]|uniref:AAA family ATPase n=1 Tax=uncultured Desulfobacteraceae bacterium TaxID=218296 RepID=A0A484HPZ1_9BACT|nr:AAA family ATPase [uncultured Desulfobacteraceae bacterium]